MIYVPPSVRWRTERGDRGPYKTRSFIDIVRAGRWGAVIHTCVGVTCEPPLPPQKRAGRCGPARW
jgi:hypothetical protein